MMKWLRWEILLPLEDQTVFLFLRLEGVLPEGKPAGSKKSSVFFRVSWNVLLMMINFGLDQLTACFAWPIDHVYSHSTHSNTKQLVDLHVHSDYSNMQELKVFIS